MSDCTFLDVLGWMTDVAVIALCLFGILTLARHRDQRSPRPLDHVDAALIALAKMRVVKSKKILARKTASRPSSEEQYP